MIWLVLANSFVNTFVEYFAGYAHLLARLIPYRDARFRRCMGRRRAQKDGGNPRLIKAFPGFPSP